MCPESGWRFPRLDDYDGRGIVSVVRQGDPESLGASREERRLGPWGEFDFWDAPLPEQAKALPKGHLRQGYAGRLAEGLPCGEGRGVACGAGPFASSGLGIGDLLRAKDAFHEMA